MTRGTLIATAFLLAAPAVAVTPSWTGGSVQRFDPAPAPFGGLSSGSGEILAPNDWALQLLLNYARNPLVVRRNGVRVNSVVENNLTAQLSFAYGLFDIVEFGVSAPFVAFQNGSSTLVPIAAQTAGDLRLEPKISVFQQWRHGLSVSVTPVVTIPMGDALNYNSDPSLTFAPEATVSWRDADMVVMGTIAARFRGEATLGPGTALSHEFTLRGGVTYTVAEAVDIIGELNGGVATGTWDRGTAGNPLEVVGGGRVHFEDKWALTLGVGGGLLSAPGTPDLRVLGMATYGSGLHPRPPKACIRFEPAGEVRVQMRGRDLDSDGIDEACDLCPDVAETVNGVADDDGCPETDRDGDRILDASDACPDLAGPAPSGCPDKDADGVFDPADECVDVAGPQPTGCPDTDGDGVLDRDDKCVASPGAPPSGCPDRDGDSVIDDEDQCPDTPGDIVTGCPDTDLDGVFDKDDLCVADPGLPPTGCPDRDGDGIFDSKDKCPDAAEDMDKFEDEDGCPDEDNDKDGVPDVADRCPLVAEDRDGFMDEDGCPDPDNDTDGVLDAADKCPDQPETINGFEDEDGCPDKGKSLVVVTATKIEILDKVFFKTGSDVIDKVSFVLLKQVALVVKATPRIERLRVEGHTDDVGGRAQNQDLSQRRAASVRKFLVQEGVAGERLFARGYGPDRPIVPNLGEKNRAKNRRVEFTILAPGDEP